MVSQGEIWQADTKLAVIEDEVVTCSPDSDSDSNPTVALSDDSENESQRSQVLTRHVCDVIQKYSRDFGMTTSLEDYMELGRLDLRSDARYSVRNISDKAEQPHWIAIASERSTSTIKGSNHRLKSRSHVSTTAEDSDGECVCVCHHCHLPRGEICYKRDGNYLHGECLAQVIAQDGCKSEAVHQESDALRKKERRKEYHIGWDASKIPRNDAPASKLALRDVGQGMVCLVLQNSSVRVASTADPAESLNLEYLSIALQVRQREGHEPIFSLNPVDSSDKHTMQSKVFVPEWLAGTSVGDVLFEADYYLKELSMGEYEQPVLGMKSCLEHSDEDGFVDEWKAREWFMVRKAEIRTSESDVLIPHVQLGVEAREQVLNSNGLQDSPLTRTNHPMVKYAEQFSHFFDLIAERRSVIFHLRELAKASVVAKYIVDADIYLEDGWFHLNGDKDIPCSLEVPQLWNEELRSAVEVKDGTLMQDGQVVQVGRGSHMKKHGVYGGVAFGLDRFKLASGLERTLSSGIEGLRMRDFGRSGDMRMRGTTSGIPGQRLQGVDLRLDQFDLAAPKKVTLEARSGSWCDSLLSLDACAPVADAFWIGLGHNSKTFREEDANLLRQIFNEKISDRRTEGELFTPPEASHSYVNKLRGLLKEEMNILQLRKEKFSSKEFAMNAPGPIFPRSWSLLSETSKLPERAPHGVLHAREDMKGPALSQICHSAPPVFERSTEDGIIFRIYRVGSIEVRTTQENGSKEYVEVVFSIREPSSHCDSSKCVKESESITKVVEFVESVQGGLANAGRPKAHYYIVLETESGGKVVTEMMENGKLRWQINPVDLVDRNSLARVVRMATCATPVLVQEVHSYLMQMETRLTTVASQSVRKQYARNVFDMACHHSSRQDFGVNARAAPTCKSFGAGLPMRSNIRRSPFKC